MDPGNYQVFDAQGPVEDQPFSLQTTHISAAYASADERYEPYRNRTLRTRSNWKAQVPHASIGPYIMSAGLFKVCALGLTTSRGLVSALIERWRPETHTFLMPFGEVTITLEDVHVLFGLPVDGDSLCFTTNIPDVNAVCMELLGDVPPTRRGNQIPINWLASRFVETDPDFHLLDPVIHEQHARAFMLRMLGGLLFPNANGACVDVSYLLLFRDFARAGTISWGSALLAHLYREMCNATKYDSTCLNGCSKLLTVWAYERLPHFRPRNLIDPPHDLPLAYRYSGKLCNIDSHSARAYLDTLHVPPTQREWIWQPYGERSPNPQQFAVRVFVIHYNVVEGHQADRVLRQFGVDQPIPNPPLDCDYLHVITRSGRTDARWWEIFSDYLRMWSERQQYQIPLAQLPRSTPLDLRSAYMVWYRQHSVAWYTEESRRNVITASTLEQLQRIPVDQGVREFASQVSQTLDVGHYHRVGHIEQDYSSQAPPMMDIQYPTYVIHDNPPPRAVRNRPYSQRRRGPRRLAEPMEVENQLGLAVVPQQAEEPHQAQEPHQAADPHQAGHPDVDGYRPVIPPVSSTLTLGMYAPVPSSYVDTMVGQLPRDFGTRFDAGAGSSHNAPTVPTTPTAPTPPTAATPRTNRTTYDATTLHLGQMDWTNMPTPGEGPARVLGAPSFAPADIIQVTGPSQTQPDQSNTPPTTQANQMWLRGQNSRTRNPRYYNPDFTFGSPP